MKQQQPPVPTISRPSDDTIRAYEQTDYFAEDQPPVCLRIIWPGWTATRRTRPAF